MLAKPVLLAIPVETNNLSGGDSFADHLRSGGFVVVEAFSYEDALEIIQSQNLFAVVMISDWAMEQDNFPGLIEFLKDKVPTYSLITQTTMQKVGYDWFDKLYKDRMHEYQGMPSDVDAIIVWLNGISQHP